MPALRVGRRALAASLLLVGTGWSTPALGQIADPVPGTVPVGAIAVHVELVAVLPDSGPGSDPEARPMTLVGDGSGRRFVADQNGIVYQIHSDDSLSVFLDVDAATSLLTNQRQLGLTSIAFHPDYHVAGADGEGLFYTTSSQSKSSGTPDYPVPAGAPTNHHGVLHEWAVSADPDAIDPGSARELLRIGQPYKDHNLAQISFRDVAPGHPDRGLLFVAVADGGNTGCCPRPVIDPHFTGQSLATPLGSMLRIDPIDPPGAAAYGIPAGNPFVADGDPDTLGEIWAYGLRNPHRFSWDAGGAGLMLISDIGQSNIEEIDVGAPGANYGWSEREGTFLVEHDNELEVFALPPDDASYGYTYPVIQYDHDEGDVAVSGGSVYRGAPFSSLTGRYVFGDLVSGRVFHVPVADLEAGGPVGFEQLRLVDAADDQEKTLAEMVGGGPPASRTDLRFGSDDAGAIYLLTKQDGAVRRLAPAAAVPSILPRGLGLLALLLAAAGAAALLRRSRAATALGLLALVAPTLWLGCATPPERVGQRLFAGCAEAVDDGATQRRGLFVCEGERDPAPFDGNGRACGDCHVPGDAFGMSVRRIADLPDDHPFFFSGLDEDPRLLREHGMVHVVVPGQLDEFRQTPKLVHLRSQCDEDGNCTSLGLLGDRVRNLCAFSIQAVANHMAKTVDRVPGRDFRLPSREECEALVAYMLSDLVAGER